MALPIIKDGLDLYQNEAATTRSAILVLPHTLKFAGEKISGFERKSFTRHNSPDSRLKFRIQNLPRHDQTGEFLLRIRPLVCKRQNHSGAKTFRIRYESGTISASVNLLSVARVVAVYKIGESLLTSLFTFFLFNIRLCAAKRWTKIH